MSETDDHAPQEPSPASGGQDDRWVLLSEHRDRLDAAFVEDELTRASIPSTTTRRAGDDHVVFRILVSPADEARARAILGGTLEAPAAPASAAGKSPRLVWGLAILPGCGHFYAGETARGAMILLAFLSCFYWSAADHIILLGRFFLYGVDVLGARAALQGRRPLLWHIAAWTAPLWVATPALLQKAAPDVYIGSAGRVMCGAEERCRVEMEDDCTTATAAQIGSSFQVRSAVSECAAFIEGRSCVEVYGTPEDRGCDTSPFCAAAGTAEEAACIDIYRGTVGEYGRPRLWVRPPQGWGM